MKDGSCFVVLFCLYFTHASNYNGARLVNVLLGFVWGIREYNTAK